MQQKAENGFKKLLQFEIIEPTASCERASEEQPSILDKKIRRSLKRSRNRILATAAVALASGIVLGGTELILSIFLCSFLMIEGIKKHREYRRISRKTSSKGGYDRFTKALQSGAS